MSATLTTLTDRIEVVLDDTTNLVYTAAAITEAIRLALVEWNQTLKATDTLSGLDSAVTTTLTPEGESILVVGSAGYAAQTRSLKRIEAANPSAVTPDQLAEWADHRLAQFRRQLAAYRLKGLLAGAVPWSTTAPWPLDDDDDNAESTL